VTESSILPNPPSSARENISEVRSASGEMHANEGLALGVSEGASAPYRSAEDIKGDEKKEGRGGGSLRHTCALSVSYNLKVFREIGESLVPFSPSPNLRRVPSLQEKGTRTCTIYGHGKKGSRNKIVQRKGKDR